MKVTGIERRASEAIMAVAKESPNNALSLLTTHLVGLAVALAKQNGVDSNKEITLTATGERSITIHSQGEI